jgi:hypothetical protein
VHEVVNFGIGPEFGHKRAKVELVTKGRIPREGLPEVGTAVSPCKECTLLLCKIAFSSSLEAMCLLSMFVVLNSKHNHFMFQCSCHVVHLNCQALAGLS